jgi:glutathionylspermidine synthase
MIRRKTKERQNWRGRAEEFGFNFCTMYGKPYWDESVYYQFSSKQIEDDIEDPTEELHQMCIEVVGDVVADDKLMARFQIPESQWDLTRRSWLKGERSLYSRLDLAYDGKSHAKMLENNADTPTSVYESAFWQLLWLEDKITNGDVDSKSDQFNSLQEKLIDRFEVLCQPRNKNETLYFSCCKDSIEDKGTVQYLMDCADESDITTKFIYIEDIGHGVGDGFVDLDDQSITWMFKLYPWEFMFREEYSSLLLTSGMTWLEPPWKSLLSNKALMPLLWERFSNHPNLLPSYFEDNINSTILTSNYVKKPIFSREGSNVSVYKKNVEVASSGGVYGEEGFIYQTYHPLPVFGKNHTLIGSWLVDDKAAGISIREDFNMITQDLARCVPHIIL